MKKILLYNSGGGLGDSIQLFSLILSLQNHYKKAEFFYLGAHSNHFKGQLKDFGIKIDTLDLKLKYFGFRWWHLFVARQRVNQMEIEKFDLIIDLQSKIRNTIILLKIPHNNFYSSTFGFKFCSKKSDYDSKNHLVNLSKFFDTSIKSINYNLKKIPEIYKEEAKRLLPDKNYIGFSITQGNKYRKKSWKVKNFVDLANKVSNENKIPVFFIEKNNKELIDEIKSQVPTAIFPETQTRIASPPLVTALGSRLDLAVSIDNGVMHMLSLAKIPMIILFGPTDSEKFSPGGDSIKILDSKTIYKTKNINSISVYDVFKLIQF